MRSIAHADHGIEARYLASLFVRQDAIEEAAISISDLASPAHQAILGAMLAVRARGEEVTPLSVHVALEGRRALQDRAAEIGSILETDSITCARRIRELAERRRIHNAAQHAIVQAGNGDTAAARATLAEVALADDGGDEDPILTCRQLMVEALAAFVEHKTGGKYIKLGLPTLNECFAAGPGDLVVIGAATNVGKSTMVTTLAVDMARRGVSVGVISIEDGAADFGSKVLSALSGVPSDAMWKGAATAEDFDRMERAIDVGTDLPIRFAKVRSRSIEAVVSRMARMVRVNGARVIFVDYLQAIRHRSIGKDTRERVNDSLSMLMAAAAQLEVTLVLCSQLRRADGSKFHEPHDGELKESGDIENSAQCIVLLWRETDDPDDDRFGAVYGKIAKVKRTTIGKRFWMRMENGVFVERREPAPARGGGSPFVPKGVRR